MSKLLRNAKADIARHRKKPLARLLVEMSFYTFGASVALYVMISALH